MRMIFVNLPVKDLERSKAFYAALGFQVNPQFSDDNAACMVVEENIFVMLLTEGYFKGFITGEISDANAATEVITCLSGADRAEVDAFLDKALKAGGQPWRPKLDMGFVYGCSFQDPDGHVWEMSYVDMAAMPAAEPAAA